MLDDETRKVLMARYGHVYAEITRYRDYEWKITQLTLVLIGAVIAASLQYKDKMPSGSLGHAVTAIVLFLVVGGGVFGVLSLRWIHARLALNWKMRAEIEQELKLPAPYAHHIRGTKPEDYASIWPFNLSFRLLIACIALLGILIVSWIGFK
jgi:hypothetical protein